MQMQTSRSLFVHVQRLDAHEERIIAGGIAAFHCARRITASDVFVMAQGEVFFVRDLSVRAGDVLPTGCIRPFIKDDVPVIAHDQFITVHDLTV
jgi:hypothetical protein